MAGEEGESGTFPVRAVFAALAFGSLTTGLIIHLLQEQLGIPADTAQMIVIVFIVVGIADALLVYFWDSIFGRRD